MFLRQEIVLESLRHLDQVHPFFGIGFLVCKLNKLPVGNPVPFRFGHKEAEFLLKYYHPNLRSNFFFQPFRTSNSEARWLAPKYPHAGSQSIRTRGDIADAFVHQKKTNLWAWKPSYVNVLSGKLQRDGAGKVPAFWLAVWILRHELWSAGTTCESVIQEFSNRFLLTNA